MVGTTALTTVSAANGLVVVGTRQAIDEVAFVRAEVPTTRNTTIAAILTDARLVAVSSISTSTTIRPPTA